MEERTELGVKSNVLEKLQTSPSDALLMTQVTMSVQRNRRGPKTTARGVFLLEPQPRFKRLVEVIFF